MTSEISRSQFLGALARSLLDLVPPSSPRTHPVHCVVTTIAFSDGKDHLVLRIHLDLLSLNVLPNTMSLRRCENVETAILLDCNLLRAFLRTSITEVDNVPLAYPFKIG